NVRLRPKLLWELRPGTRVVSNYFECGDWKPDVTTYAHHRNLLMWIIPAWVQGRWHCTVNVPGAHHRPHFVLNLHRRYQQVWGTARAGGGARAGREVPLIDPRLLGDQLSFTLAEPKLFRPATRYACR